MQHKEDVFGGKVDNRALGLVVGLHHEEALNDWIRQVRRDAPRLVLIVEDVQETYQDLVQEGVVFTKEPMRAPWNQDEVFAQFRDSEGNGIVIGSVEPSNP